jgi:hypothetical protein
MLVMMELSCSVPTLQVRLVRSHIPFPVVCVRQMDGNE